MKKYTVKTSKVLQIIPRLNEKRFLNWVREGLIPNERRSSRYYFSPDDYPLILRVMELMEDKYSYSEAKEKISQEFPGVFHVESEMKNSSEEGEDDTEDKSDLDIDEKKTDWNEVAAQQLLKLNENIMSTLETQQDTEQRHGELVKEVQDVENSIVFLADAQKELQQDIRAEVITKFSGVLEDLKIQQNRLLQLMEQMVKKQQETEQQIHLLQNLEEKRENQELISLKQQVAELTRERDKKTKVLEEKVEQLLTNKSEKETETVKELSGFKKFIAKTFKIPIIGG